MGLPGKLNGEWLLYPHDHTALTIMGSETGADVTVFVSAKDGKGVAVEGNMIGKGSLTIDKDVKTSTEQV